MRFSTLRLMRGAFAVLLLGACLAVSAGPFGGQETPKLAIPDGQSLLVAVHARGVQIYESQTSAAEPKSFEWTLKGPEATLFDGAGKKVGKHSAGPTWEWSDGSRVVGSRVASVAGSRPEDVPWLLLKATSSTPGFLADVSYVLRVDTSKGAPPARLPEAAGRIARVPYEATYLFLVPAKP